MSDVAASIGGASDVREFAIEALYELQRTRGKEPIVGMSFADRDRLKKKFRSNLGVFAGSVEVSIQLGHLLRDLVDIVFQAQEKCLALVMQVVWERSSARKRNSCPNSFRR